MEMASRIGQYRTVMTDEVRRIAVRKFKTKVRLTTIDADGRSGEPQGYGKKTKEFAAYQALEAGEYAAEPLPLPFTILGKVAWPEGGGRNYVPTFLPFAAILAHFEIMSDAVGDQKMTSAVIPEVTVHGASSAHEEERPA